MSSDWDLVSKEDHELEYILKKYDKRTTQENKDKLCDIIDDFKADSSYSPYYHRDLYRYFKNNPRLLNSLEDK
jgi:hypothetical protein